MEDEGEDVLIARPRGVKGLSAPARAPHLADGSIDLLESRAFRVTGNREKEGLCVERVDKARGINGQQWEWE